jgi:hypothetical protein
MNPDSHTAGQARPAKGIAAIPAESIPFIGVAVLIADAGYELYAAWEAVRDLDQLYSDFGMARGMQSLRWVCQSHRLY